MKYPTGIVLMGRFEHWNEYKMGMINDEEIGSDPFNANITETRRFFYFVEDGKSMKKPLAPGFRTL